MIKPSFNGEYYELRDPKIMPKASGFLWNDCMMINMNCRGYAVTQHMQPEPAKYSYGPTIEAKTFMQPEQPYYAHHPGRFIYVKDEATNEMYSVPYEPMRKDLDSYLFEVGKTSIKWCVTHLDIEIEMTVTLPVDEALELWTIKVKNLSKRYRKLSIYPYYTVGYMSWMNQSAHYNKDQFSIVCESVTPYQKYTDYEQIKKLKDMTVLIAESEPTAWEVSQEQFEGEGGITDPTSINYSRLAEGVSNYEMPVAVMQYQIEMHENQEEVYRFIFGPLKEEADIMAIRNKYYGQGSGSHPFEQIQAQYDVYINEGKGNINIKTKDDYFDNFVNHWLPRQMYYHGVTNRLSTDPQTRNYLQDNMGMSYIKPALFREAFLIALAQQNMDGSMPDGIIISEGASLKYINQVPHKDHCLWLPICLSAYLDETNDYDLLNEKIGFSDSKESMSVYDHMDLALTWLIADRDHRGLNYIDQGDWCDPMNMVGYKGRGVSAWITIASAYAFRLFADISFAIDRKEQGNKYLKDIKLTTDNVNRYLWDGKWYARGITDDNVIFGTQNDQEGRIFLNPQAWSLLGGIADEDKKHAIIMAVEEQLVSPYGVELLAPSFTAMREDIGRVTQKYPGTAENGSVYNHAAAFYVYALYGVGQNDRAYDLLRKMIPGPDMEDLIRRGQLPTFIPNYYRGAYRQIKRAAGRSSHLFNTGTIQWFYRCMMEGLFGLKGCREGLMVDPKLPSHWSNASVVRHFRGATYNVTYEKTSKVQSMTISVNSVYIKDNIVRTIEEGTTYEVVVSLPQS